MENTLTSLLAPSAVPMETLHARYGPLLELVRKLIGVVPNCDPYLEIWPPGFVTYNVMVPGFLNLPFSIWGFGAPKDVLGLAMYVASRTAECAYCSAHTCSFALRRGATQDKVAHALQPGASYTPVERAAVAVARSLAAIPATLTADERDALRSACSPADAEWIVLGVCMMGFLNKFMDAVGVELESATIGEVQALIGPSGWAPGKHLDPDAPPAAEGAPRADGLGTKLSIVRYLPAALSLNRKWSGDAPDRWPAVGDYLRECTGHDFPVLASLSHARAIRAIAVMLRDNLETATSVLGLPTKYLAGVVYAIVIEDASLEEQMRALAAHHELAPEMVEEVACFARTESLDRVVSVDETAQVALRLARAISTSPARIPDKVVDACRASLKPAAIVELVVWISVLQMLHRLETFFAE